MNRKTKINMVKNLILVFFTIVVSITLCGCAFIQEKYFGSENKKTIMFELNGGKWISNYTAPATYLTGNALTLPDATQITKDGYAFDGWFDNKDFSGSSITFISSDSTEDKTLYAKWTIVTYTITYVLNEGNWNNDYAAPDTYSTIQTVTLPNATNILKHGYTFAGWYDNEAYSGNAITSISSGSKDNKTLYAKWSTTQYTITYNLNNGEWSNNFTPSSTYTIDQTVTLPITENITKNGYTFAGWYDNEACSGNAITSISSGSKDNKTLYAKWTAIPYTITYNLNEGNWNNEYTAPTTYTKVQTVTLPNATNITKNGYIFAGWYDNESYSGNAITSLSSSSTGNKTLYAKWVVGVCTITYYLNDGEWNYIYTAPTTYTTDQSITLPDSDYLSKHGYTFAGWYENETFSGDAITLIETGSTANKILYAKWTAISYAITYNLNEGVWSNDYTALATYTVDQTVTLPTATQITRTGYTFAGWYTDEYLYYSPITSIPLGSTENKTLYAKWIQNTYTITYNLNGGYWIYGSDSDTYTTDQSITLPDSDYLSKPGYTFAGWYENETFSGDAITLIETGSTANKILYAKWTTIPYAITYNLNEGVWSNDYTAPATYTVDQTVTLPTATQITRTGYKFEGWYTDEYFSYGLITTIPVDSTENITLYAKWGDLEKYAISFYMNGGTWITDYVAPATYTIDQSITLPDATQITKTGYTFKGWYDNETFSGDIVTTISLGTAEIKSYYAKWEATEVYTITYNLNDGTWTDDYIAPSTFKADQVITLPDSEKLSKADNSFAGWYSNSGFIGKVLTTIEEGTTGNKILYARWNTNHYADASNVSEVIANLPSGGLYTLFVTGVISDTTISDINTELSNNSSVKVNLDLSGTTGLEKINSSAFSSRTNLISIIIPEGVTLIEYRAFFECTSLTKIVLPESLITIGQDAFLRCNSLTNVIFPDKLTTIGERAFGNCTTLTSVTIPGSITEQGPYIFSGCNKITDVTFVDGVTEIGSYMFESCTSLSNVTIPTSVNKINEYVFSGCTSLASVIIPGSVVSIESYTFNECSNLSDLTILNGVKEIKRHAFRDCTSLKNVTIPASITSIDKSSFYYSSYYSYDFNILTSFTVDADNTTYSSSADGNLLLSKDGTILYEYMTIAENIIIPDTVTAIADNAFSYRGFLKSVTIPASVISIGKNAFYFCGYLSSITFEDTTTWYYTVNDNYTNGTLIDVTDPSSNNGYLRSSYSQYYWYKE